MTAQVLAAALLGMAAFAAAVGGFLALGLTTERHWQEAGKVGRRPRLRRCVQALGALALIASLLCCAALRRNGYGFVPWIAFLTAAVWIAIGLLSQTRLNAARVARLVGMLAAASCMAALVLRFG
ncbi:DUF3325 family protein [Massilia sp. CFBP9026]|uniref:DUF3325 family protein n=1 Tax=Massilia sp. CFBP9026 TaxID=3096536 RepID=UPI002A6B43AF|nr:DUF3325 family protein [Massilia sp. CFBP9026]MDY0960497.1 DUF3325 family protein [Massilia sp. CFBP9026]